MDYVKNLREMVGHRPLILPGAVVIIENDRGEILLQHRRDGDWGLPGGLMELGESYEETARREVWEETGLRIGELTFVDVFSGPEYYLKVENGDELYSVTAVFTTRKYQGTLKVDLQESIKMEFFRLNDLPTGLTATYQHFVDTYLKKQGRKCTYNEMI